MTGARSVLSRVWRFHLSRTLEVMTVNGTMCQMMLSILHALFEGLLKIGMYRNASDMTKR